MATRTKALTTELKDLDVDRVDGVDRPATGRAFALYKSRDSKPIMKEEITTMAETITKDQLAQLMKNYAAVATAADMLLKAFRVDKSGRVSKSTAIAANGLAQIMGSEPVFVTKAVPTQPYEYSEPNVDERGPADEDLGGNFTPRSMPGSMVGRVQFAVKAAPMAPAAPAVADEDDKQLPAFMKSIEDAIAKGIETAVAKVAAPVAAPVAVAKAEVAAPVVAPASKQVVTAEQREVRKGQGYRFGESFENVVFTPRG
jgi:hypothetical protein